MQIDLAHATTVFGAQASKVIKGVHWTFTLVVCTQCGLSQTFTANAQELAKHVPGANVTTVPAR